jgi:hypothetical protein
MQSRRFLAMATLAGVIGLAACEGAGEHRVPDEDGEELPANATLQDSAAAGQAVVDQAPVVAEEIKSPVPALPTGTGNQPTPTPSGAPVNPAPTPH